MKLLAAAKLEGQNTHITSGNLKIAQQHYQFVLQSHEVVGSCQMEGQNTHITSGNLEIAQQHYQFVLQSHEVVVKQLLS